MARAVAAPSTVMDTSCPSVRARAPTASAIPTSAAGSADTTVRTLLLYRDRRPVGVSSAMIDPRSMTHTRSASSVSSM